MPAWLPKKYPLGLACHLRLLVGQLPANMFRGRSGRELFLKVYLANVTVKQNRRAGNNVPVDDAIMRHGWT